MSLLHEAIVAEKYGLRLTIDQLGKALCLAPQTMDGFIGWCVVYDSLATHLAASSAVFSLDPWLVPYQKFMTCMATPSSIPSTRPTMISGTPWGMPSHSTHNSAINTVLRSHKDSEYLDGERYMAWLVQRSPVDRLMSGAIRCGFNPAAMMQLNAEITGLSG